MVANRISFHDRIVTESVAQTRALGAELAAGLDVPVVVVLTGPPGAGKTEFVKGFTAAWGCSTEASSPSFALVHEYHGGRFPVFHLDFYRLHSPDEVWGVGWEDLLPGSVLFVEWGERFPNLLPADALQVRIAGGSVSRREVCIGPFFVDSRP